MTVRHRLRPLAAACVFALVLGLLARTGDAVADQATLDAINTVRTGSGCPAAAGALMPERALLANPLLDAAAAELSRQSAGVGRPLNEVLRSAGYRATRSMVLQVNGVAPGAALARFIEQRYCEQIASPEWRDIGVARRLAGTQTQTWLVLAHPLTLPSPERAAGIGTEVLELVNQARGAARTCGDKPFSAAPPVRWNATLARAGRLHAEDMAAHSYFSHDGRDGSKPADRATRVGYIWRSVGENIAAGQTTPEDVVRGWIDSPPHCANLMSPRFTEMGVAYAVNPDSKMAIYWAQVFGTPR